MFDLGQLRYAIDIDSKKAYADLQSFDKAFKAFGDRATKIGKSLNKNLTLPIVAVGGAALKLAADFEVASRKFSGAFSGAEAQASEAVENLNKNFGIATSQATSLLAFTGDLLKGFGATSEQALDLATSTNEVAAALAAYNGVPVAQASEAITKALLGERESLKLLGVSIQESAVQAELLKRGQQDLTGQALLLAKANITLSLAAEQSTDAIANFADNTDTLAFQTQSLIADLKDVGVVLGTALIPLAKEAVGVIRDWAEGLKELDAEQVENILKLAAFAAAAGPAVMAIGGITKAVTGLSAAVGFLAANPIVAAVAGVAALSIGLGVLLDKNKEKRLQELTTQFSELAKSTGVAEDEMETFVQTASMIEAALGRGQFGGLEEAAYQVEQLSQNSGLTVEQITRIGIESENISDNFKEILASIQEQEKSENNILAAELERSLALSGTNTMVREMKETQAEQVRVAAEQAAEEERVTSELEKQKALREESLRATIDARINALETYNKDIQEAQNKYNLGLISEQDLLKENLSAAEKHAEALISAGYDGADANTLGNKELLRQTEIIQALRTQLGELSESEKERLELKQVEQEKLKEIAETREQIETQAAARFFEINATEEQLIEQRYNLEIQKAKQVGADTSVIEAYYANQRVKLANKTAKQEIAISTEKMQQIVSAMAQAEATMNTFLGATQDNWTETFDQLADQFLKMAAQSGNAYVMAAAVAIKAISSIAKMVKSLSDAEEARKELVQDVEKQIADIRFKARKEAIEREYELEIQAINQIEQARIDAYLATLSAQQIAQLKAAGIIEETELERIEREKQAAIAAGDATAVALLEQEARIEQIRAQAEEERLQAEKDYKNQLAQYEYDKAVADKQAKLIEIQAAREEALAGLKWWQWLAGWDEDVKKTYSKLYSTVNSLAIPAPVFMAQGGIVNNPGPGIPAVVGEAGPEAVIPLNDRTLGMLGQAITDSTSASTSPIGGGDVIINFEGNRVAVIKNGVEELLQNRILKIPSSAIV